MTTLSAALAEGRRRLRAARIESSALDARLLLARALACAMTEVIGHPERPLADRERAAFDRLIARRAQGEPIAYIVGEKEFWSHDFRVGRETLVPRPETERVVETALARIEDRARPLTLLDLGTGSGCILLSLLAELPRARGVGVDIAEGAIGIARANAARLGLSERARWCVGHWGEALAGPFDLIVGNPPYIARGEWADLPRDITRFEPEAALLAGEDGLAAFRQIVPSLPRLLAPGGAVVLEIGATQGAAVVGLLRHHVFQDIDMQRDLSGRPRCVGARAPGRGFGKKTLGTPRVPD